MCQITFTCKLEERKLKLQNFIYSSSVKFYKVSINFLILSGLQIEQSITFIQGRKLCPHIQYSSWLLGNIIQCIWSYLFLVHSRSTIHPCLQTKLNKQKQNKTKLKYEVHLYCLFTHWSVIKLTMASPLKKTESFPNPTSKSALCQKPYTLKELYFSSFISF
jgi:hypothetical protein